MSAEFPQIVWDTATETACRALVEMAKAEDLSDGHDWTTEWIVPEDACATARVVSRAAGVVAGLPAISIVTDGFVADVTCELQVADGQSVTEGDTVAVLSGSARSLLTVERTILNFLGRLSGIATLTQAYVDRVQGTAADIYDTRKTTPGWRLPEKYAVACGGGRNHRLGLSQALMIKDNHIALAAATGTSLPLAIRTTREQMQRLGKTLPLEVEVDSLSQLRECLPERPDIVLLDNMTTQQLSEAVALRGSVAPEVVLEASGGVTLDTVAEIAATGVDRISVGALTHSARNFDLGLDWD